MRSGEPETPGPTVPTAAPDMRRPFLRRAWVAWTATLLLLAASVGTMAWLRSDRNDLVGQTAEAGERLAEAGSEVERGERRLEYETNRTDSLTAALDACVDALRADRPLLSAWIDHMTGIRDQNVAQADEAFDRMERARRRSNRALDVCRDEAAREGVYG